MSAADQVAANVTPPELAASLGKVAVLFGGLSAEREVSLMSGRGVLAALRSQGVDAHPFDPAEQPLQALRDQGFDRVFIALHGRYGEDGSLQGALELLGIPYTGSSVMASALAMDKTMTKRIWQSQGLPTPPFLDVESAADVEKIVPALGLPVMLKAPHEGSTIGVTKVNQAAELMPVWQQTAALDASVLAEAFVAGRELTVTVLGKGAQAHALPIIEIVAPEGNYDFHNKYYSDDTRYLCPAPLQPEVTAQIQELAVRAFRALGCEGWGRVDVLLGHIGTPQPGADPQPMLLEINTSPGMTGHSLTPMAARALGISYEQLCVQVLAGASLKIGQTLVAPAARSESEH